MAGGDFGEPAETPCEDDTICEECEGGCDTVDTEADTGGEADAFTG